MCIEARKLVSSRTKSVQRKKTLLPAVNYVHIFLQTEDLIGKNYVNFCRGNGSVA